MFISFEGIEGSGKSTLMEAVNHALRAEGHRTLLTREPGGTPAGDSVRDIFLEKGLRLSPVSELLLLNASRAELVHQIIEPALEEGIVVLCDRFVHSSVAYQGYGRGLPLDFVQSVCDAATGGLMPDLTLFVDISYETSCGRQAGRGRDRDRMEEQDREFYERARRGFTEISDRDPRVIRIDGERPPDQVADAALAALSAVMV